MIATRVGDSNFASPFPQTCPLSAPVGLLRSWARKRRQTKLLTRDEARRLAANFAKPELVEAEAVKPPAITRSRRNYARARARARRWRRELGGGVRQHPGSNNCVEGARDGPRYTARRRGN